MFKSKKIHQKLSLEGASLNDDENGKIFNTPSGLQDFSDVEIIHTGLDTAKTLYKGNMNLFVYDAIEAIYENGFNQIIDLKKIFITDRQFQECLFEEFGGELKFVVRPGGRSGYRYMLQNNSAGIVIHLGSKFRKREDKAANLKIEFSPHFIVSHAVEGTEKISDWIADGFVKNPMKTGADAHLCIDVQGWKPPTDFSSRLTTRSRRIINFLGDQEAIYDHHGDIAYSYTKNLGYLYGSVKNCQMSIYRKDIEARKDGDFEWWEDIWLKNPNYDSEAPIYRIEFRFHHSLLKQVEEGYLIEGLPAKNLNSLQEVMKHADSLWLYGLNTFRLDHSRTYVSADWQFLAENVSFDSPEILRMKRHRRQPKMGDIKDAVYGISRLVSYYSRHPHMQGNTLVQMLKRFDPVLLKNYMDYQDDKGRITGNYLQEQLDIRRMTK